MKKLLKIKLYTNVSNETGDELLYRNINVMNILENNFSLGKTIGLLWFNINFNYLESNFIEKVIVLCADHGPAVSGAHNTIVASRANKDIISSLCSSSTTSSLRMGRTTL